MEETPTTKSKPNGTRLFREALKKRLDENTFLLNIIEVHEDEKDKAYYINIRDIIPDQTNVCFPMTMCKKVIDALNDSKVTPEADTAKVEYNLSLIKNSRLESDDKKYSLEFADTETDKKLLRGGIVLESAEDKEKPWKVQGQVELNPVFTGRMIKVLNDIMIRYQSIPNLPIAPSFYSTSGGRRFYFDLRETRWGKRLQVSQLTSKRRNTIGVPLENLVQFRERLDYFIKELSLEDGPTLDSEPAELNKIRQVKKNRRGPPRPRKAKVGTVYKPKVAESTPDAVVIAQ